MDKVDELTSYLWKHAEENKELTLGVAAVGALYLAGKALHKLGAFWRYALRPSLSLKERYGDGWAIVTGASDGIGRAYAHELAKRGFKVGLIARSQLKLEVVAKELETLYKVQTKIVIFDFDGFYSEEKITELTNKLEVFDSVSILINNVGVLFNKVFDQHISSHILSLVNVNIVGLTVITKLLLPKLLANPNKGGIINIGSGTTRFVFPGMNVYSATKAYVTNLSASLAKEYKDKLDVLLATVGPTKTRMNPGIITLASYPESVAAHTLNTLGWESHTFGDFRHALRCYFLETYVFSASVCYIDRSRIAAAQKNK